MLRRTGLVIPEERKRQSGSVLSKLVDQVHDADDMGLVTAGLEFNMVMESSFYETPTARSDVQTRRQPSLGFAGTAEVWATIGQFVTRFKKSADTGTTRSIRIRLELDRDKTDIDTTPNSAINPENSGNSAEMPSYLSRLDQFTEKKRKTRFLIFLIFSSIKTKKKKTIFH